MVPKIWHDFDRALRQADRVWEEEWIDMIKKKTTARRPDSAALFVRLSRREKEALDTAAAKAGFSSVSQWLRVVKLREELMLANA